MNEFRSVTVSRPDVGTGVLNVEICEYQSLVGTLYYAKEDLLGCTGNHVYKEEAIRTLLGKYGFTVIAIGPPFSMAGRQE